MFSTFPWTKFADHEYFDMRSSAPDGLKLGTKQDRTAEPVPVSAYRSTSPIRKCLLIGPYRRPMPRVLGGVLGGWTFSYERGTPVWWEFKEPT